MTASVITASSLALGHVVYLRLEGACCRWLSDIQAATLLKEEDLDAALARAAEAVAENEIIDPYAVAVEIRDGRIEPLSLRERIRAHGPTTGDAKIALSRSAA